MDSVHVTPATAAEMAALLARAAAERRRVVPCGSGTKLRWHDDGFTENTPVSTRGLSSGLAHYDGDLVATLPAGVTLADANAVLATAHQWLPLDPAFADRATIGGIVATNDSGPRRHRFGAPRDLIIGVEVALVDGRVARAGGRVVKNVAGYDLSRLLCGSHGSLGIITSATFKLAPMAPASRTLVARLPDVTAALGLAQALSAAPMTPSALEIQAPAARLLVRFETTEGAALRMADAARTLAEQRGARVDVLDGDDEHRVWREHDHSIWHQAACVLKVSLLPSDMACVFDTLALRAGDHFGWAAIGRAALGVLLVRLDGATASLAAAIVAVRDVVVGRGGHVLVLEAPADVRERVPPGRAPSAAGVMAEVKQRFDPVRVLRRAPGVA